MTTLTLDNFEQEVMQAKTPVVVDFWASWCGPCMMLAPVMEELDGELPQIKFCKVNVDDERDLAMEFQIDSIPTLLCVKDGHVVRRLVGYREKDARDGRTTYHIAIMPCTAKKMEAGRPEFRRDGVPNVDLVLTTQEVIRMMKESGIRFQMLEKEAPDLPFGMGSGAAEIFGASGGVAEAVARYCLKDKSKNALRMLEHSGLRGSDPVRFVTLPIGEREVHIAIVHGLSNAAKLLDQIENGEVQVDLVEVMSCRTGCVGGAGQPYALMNTKLQRAHGLYEIDRSAMFKRSERNPVINAMYDAGLEARAHELLHQEYEE